MVCNGGAGVKIGTPNFLQKGDKICIDCACACLSAYTRMYNFEKFSTYKLVRVCIIMILIKIVLDILVLF